MIRELIIASSLMIISINLTAQERVSERNYNEYQTSINAPVTGNEITAITNNNLSVSATARETPSGPGKGSIVSNQAKQLGYSNRQNVSKRSTAANTGAEVKRRRLQMHASPMGRNPHFMAMNALRVANGTGFHGRK
jgi:hypothetical protein